jgi:hypothetical protein
MIRFALGLAVSLLATATPADDLDRYVYPLRPQLETPPVSIEVTDSPESEAWARRAKALVEEWYPIVTSLLATEEFRPPQEIRLVFRRELNVPAHASGGTITINGDWIRRNPHDLGMVVHELVHVVQAYPRNRHNTGWLVEGIADYIRWWRYEPELMATRGRTRIDPAKAKYTDAYRTTAYFLAWASRTHDMRLVPELDRALRRAEDPRPVFERLTGKPLDELWEAFVKESGGS